MTRSERHPSSPYGYPCGNHTHATLDARLYCQSDTPAYDVIPELGAVGLIWTKRGNQERQVDAPYGQRHKNDKASSPGAIPSGYNGTPQTGDPGAASTARDLASPTKES